MMWGSSTAALLPPTGDIQGAPCRDRLEALQERVRVHTITMDTGKPQPDGLQQVLMLRSCSKSWPAHNRANLGGRMKMHIKALLFCCQAQRSKEQNQGPNRRRGGTP